MTHDDNELYLQVHDFWFGPEPLQPRNAFWFMGDANEPCEQFRGAVQQAISTPVSNADNLPPKALLGLIIMLDQLPRNLFRGTAQAFSGDPSALALCHHGLKQNVLGSLHSLEQSFFCMPLQHSEEISDQDLSVTVFQQIADNAPVELKPYLENSADYAKSHRDIVVRFGRYPHRNEVLGRQPTRDELNYLNSGGERFGQ